MHGTSARSLHTILAALVLLQRRTCEIKGKKLRGRWMEERRNDELTGMR